MSARLAEVVIDCVDPIPLARWWNQWLGWHEIETEPGELALAHPSGDPSIPWLLFLAVPEPKAGKNRIHLDLATFDPDDHHALVAAMLDAGASRVDVGQHAGPLTDWVVLADPEGNELCVLEPRRRYRNVQARLASIVIDARDPESLARFYVAATGWTIEYRDERSVGLHRPGDEPPDIDLVRVDDPKTHKLRVHLDVEPEVGSSVAAEVERLLACGAVPADIGQHDDPATDWVVLADPEGNELCVIPRRLGVDDPPIGGGAPSR